LGSRVPGGGQRHQVADADVGSARDDLRPLVADLELGHLEVVGAFGQLGAGDAGHDHALPADADVDDAFDLGAGQRQRLSQLLRRLGKLDVLLQPLQRGA